MLRITFEIDKKRKKIFIFSIFFVRIKVIKLLLTWDPNKRPTAEELLSSDLLPPARLEDNELQEMLRHVLANPQSKAYKHLVSRCLDQKSKSIRVVN